MPTGRVLVGAGTGYTAGGTGGNKTVTLTVDQMPSHSHDNTLAEAGGHSHSRGSMEITGRMRFRAMETGGNIADAISPTAGAFQYLEDGDGINWSATLSRSSVTNLPIDYIDFNASNSWAGATNTVANHNHTITNASTGGGSAVNIEQPWLAVYMWKRTK